MVGMCADTNGWWGWEVARWLGDCLVLFEMEEGVAMPVVELELLVDVKSGMEGGGGGGC